MKSDEEVIDKFRETCSREFSFLVDEHGFEEVAPVPSQRYQNVFEIHYAKGGGRFIVTWVAYEFYAELTVQHSSGEQVAFWHLVPEDFLESHRQGLGRGQEGELRYVALCLRQFGGDFLEGDWSGFASLKALQEKVMKERVAAQILKEKGRQAELAVKRAAVLFRAGNYAGTVAMLAPHEVLLPRAQVMKLQLARKRAKG